MWANLKFKSKNCIKINLINKLFLVQGKDGELGELCCGKGSKGLPYRNMREGCCNGNVFNALKQG